MQWCFPRILVACRLGRHALALACPQALWDSTQPSCQAVLSGAEHTPGTLSLAMGGQSLSGACHLCWLLHWWLHWGSQLCLCSP